MYKIPFLDPGITPNSDGLPGLSALRHMVGALLTYGVVICGAAAIVSAAAWALGSFSGNSHYGGKGKTGFLVSLGAAILIGSTNALITFASNIHLA